MHDAITRLYTAPGVPLAAQLVQGVPNRSKNWLGPNIVKIKYPFSAPQIREVELKNWLVEVLYPGEFSAGGSIKTGAKKRVTSRIHYARKTGALAPAKRRSVDAASFFEWACAQRGWEVLAEVVGLPRNASVVLTSPPAAKGETSKVSILSTPTDIESLQAALVACHKRNIELQEKNESLERKQREMEQLIEKRQKRADQGREHGRKGRGVKREK